MSQRVRQARISVQGPGSASNTLHQQSDFHHGHRARRWFGRDAALEAGAAAAAAAVGAAVGAAMAAAVGAAVAAAMGAAVTAAAADAASIGGAVRTQRPGAPAPVVR